MSFPNGHEGNQHPQGNPGYSNGAQGSVHLYGANPAYLGGVPGPVHANLHPPHSAEVPKNLASHGSESMNIPSEKKTPLLAGIKEKLGDGYDEYNLSFFNSDLQEIRQKHQLKGLKKFKVTTRTDFQTYMITCLPKELATDERVLDHREVFGKIHEISERLRATQLVNTIEILDYDVHEEVYMILQKYYAQPLSQVFSQQASGSAAGSAQQGGSSAQLGGGGQATSTVGPKSGIQPITVMDYFIGAVFITEQMITKNANLKPQHLKLENFLVIKSAYSHGTSLMRSKLEASRLAMNFETLTPYMPRPDGEAADQPQLLLKLCELFMPQFHRALYNSPEASQYSAIDFKKTQLYLTISSASHYAPLLRKLCSDKVYPGVFELAQGLKTDPDYEKLREFHRETFEQYQQLLSQKTQDPLSEQYQPTAIAMPPTTNKVAGWEVVQQMKSGILFDIQARSQSMMINPDMIHYGTAQLQSDFLRAYIRFNRSGLSRLRHLRNCYKHSKNSMNVATEINHGLSLVIEGWIRKLVVLQREVLTKVMKQEGVSYHDMIFFTIEPQDLYHKTFLQRCRSLTQDSLDSVLRSDSNLGAVVKLIHRISATAESMSIDDIRSGMKDILFSFYQIISHIWSQNPEHLDVRFQQFENPVLGVSKSETTPQSSLIQQLKLAMIHAYFVWALWQVYPTQLSEVFDFNKLKDYIEDPENESQLFGEMKQHVWTHSTIQSPN